MKRSTWLVALGIVSGILAICAGGAQGAPATTTAGWGLRGGFSDDPDQVFFGTHLDLSILAGDLGFRPNATLGFGDDLTLLAISPDLVYRYPVPDIGRLYAGGILTMQVVFMEAESEFEIGWHAVAGLELDEYPLFLEVAIGLDDAPDVKVGIGYTLLAR